MKPTTFTALCLASSGCGILQDRPLVKYTDSGVPIECAESTWYADEDGDRWGDVGSATVACAAPSPTWVRTSGDCDDSDAGVLPGGVELCDGVDNNCDGTVDEPSAADARIWYIDADADGHGSTTVGGTSCAETSPGAWVPDDCDDSAAAVHPGAVEICDGVDNDCDSWIDGTDPDVDLASAPTWYADTDADGYGSADSPTVACTAPSSFVADATDCNDADSAVSPAAVEVCNDGIDNDCDGTRNGCGLTGDLGAAATAAMVEAEATNDRYGQSLSTQADFDGDGFVDLAVGAQGVEPGGLSDAGAVYVEFGPFSGLRTAGPGARFDGPFEDGRVGQTVEAAGDLNNDGFVDLLVAADATTGTAVSAGAVFITLGPISRGQSGSLSDGLAWTGGGNYHYFGDAMAGGLDLNLDGVDDLLVAASGAGFGTGHGGEVYVLLGPVSTGGTAADADHTFFGVEALDSFGQSVAGLGDIDGDGIGDFAVGADRHTDPIDEQGAVYVFHGPLSASPTAEDATVWVGSQADDRLGQSVTPTGDVDGDGLDDLLVGISGDDTAATNAGAFALVTARTGAGGDIAAASVVFLGAAESDYAGNQPASAGDIDGDGEIDLLMGVYLESSGGSSAGQAYLVYGPFSGTYGLAGADARLQPTQTNEWMGEAVSMTHDLTADGRVDAVVGARHAGSGGAVYIFAGGGG